MKLKKMKGEVTAPGREGHPSGYATSGVSWAEFSWPSGVLEVDLRASPPPPPSPPSPASSWLPPWVPAPPGILRREVPQGRQR